MSYSVSSCMILQWAYQSLYLIVREFHAFHLEEKRYGQVTGSDSNDIRRFHSGGRRPLITMDERRQGRILIRARQMYPPALSGLSACGFHVRERHVRPIHPYQAEIHDEESIELLRGLSVYHLIDEMIIFLFPSTRPNHKSVSKHLPRGEWKTVKSKTFKNGICRLVYCKTLQ